MTGGASATAGYLYLSYTSSTPDTLEWGPIQVIVKTYPEPSIRIFTGIDRSNRQLIAYMSGESLSNVKAFSPESPVLPDSVKWTTTRLTDRSIRMSANLNGRILERVISINNRFLVVHVSTSLTLLGDEVLSSVFDYWTFPTNAIDFAWVPNLRPEPNLVIGEHTFRSPAVILESGGSWMSIIPDLDSLPKLPRQRLAALDMNRLDHEFPQFGYGLKAHDPTFHVYYRHDPARVFTYEPGKLTYAYDIQIGSGANRHDILQSVNSHLWKRYGSKHVSDVRPQVLPFEAYANVSYATLDSIEQFVTFDIDGVKAGAYRAQDHGTYFILPKPLVWNQAWFNAQRSAYGQAFYGESSNGGAGKASLSEQALLTTNFSKSAPVYDGIFPAVYVYERNEWIASPLRLNGGIHRFHGSSAAWTALWMWRMQRDHQPDVNVDKMVFGLADFLVERQQTDGSIPAWFDRDPSTGIITPHSMLQHSAETAGSAMLLGELAIDTGREEYSRSLIRAADYLIAEVLPEMKYFDFETFWSCSWKSPDMTDPYTGVLPQNNYSMYWAAETFRMAYVLNNDQRYLDALLETMETLNLYQQVWNPNFLSLYAFGGFGVMNTDGEWNDSRQAVFAPLYMNVYQITGDKSWMDRGIAALRASFALFAIPENCEISPYTCKAYPPGLSPESLAHSGANGTSGRSDSGWGEAGALAASAYVTQHFGHVYVDIDRKTAFGIDGFLADGTVRKDDFIEFTLKESLGYARSITIRTSDKRNVYVTVEANENQLIRIPINQ